MGHVNSVLIGAASVAGALLTLLALWKATAPLRRRVRHVAERANRALDVVLGTPAVIDPDTEDVVIPARPDIGVRMTRTENLLTEVVLGAVEDARRSAAAAEASAAAARDSAAAARAIVERDHKRLDTLEGDIKALQAAPRRGKP